MSLSAASAASLHTDLLRIERVGKDLSSLQRRFNKLRTQVNLRLELEEEGYQYAGRKEARDEQLLLDMKKFHHMLKVYKSAYSLGHHGRSTIIDLEAVKRAKKYKPELETKARTVDPEDMDLAFMFSERLSPPLSPSRQVQASSDRISKVPDALQESIGKLKRKADREDAGGQRKRQRREKEGGKSTREEGPVPNDSLVAARIPGGGRKEPPQWILCSVTLYIPDKDKYQVRDEDASDNDLNAKTYKVLSKHVVELCTTEKKTFEKGQSVMAMFPDTTSFYPAIVVRRSGEYTSVKFADDENESGRTPSRKVETKHIFVLP
mmetsp:Transcript_31271/g.87697  ORF Transcript_31271/g.87697 Transcript_31271/m.87697 type:complete len:321 (+) Transcript_31271:92-1054(+)